MISKDASSPRVHTPMPAENVRDELLALQDALPENHPLPVNSSLPENLPLPGSLNAPSAEEILKVEERERMLASRLAKFQPNKQQP